MFTYISIEEFADGVVKNNKDANRRELIAGTAGIPCRQEKRRKMHDLRRAHLGGRQRHHGDEYVLHLHHRRGRRQ